MKLFFAIDPTKFKTLNKPENAEANGILTISNGTDIVYSHDARSGGWGKGPLPCGVYKLTSYSNQSGDAYTMQGIGWQVTLTPQFETDRTGLWIHPDGNVEGSLGCLVIPFSTVDDNIRCRNMLRDIVENGGCYLTVFQVAMPQGAKYV